MWPQHFQQIIFDVKGLPPPLQLTSGNDLGGVERSLQAYCAAYHAEMPLWTVEWHTSSTPTFRLLPLPDSLYSPAQLMAVFRALRYNSFFKAISFKDVDLTPLSSRKDYSPYCEGVVCSSLNGTHTKFDSFAPRTWMADIQKGTRSLMSILKILCKLPCSPKSFTRWHSVQSRFVALI